MLNNLHTTKPQIMDHVNKLDTNFYKISYTVNNGITIRSKEIKRNTSIGDLIEISYKHNVVDNPLNKSAGLDNCIVFNASCEYTGIHYHSITIYVKENGKVTKTKHSAHGDGSLSYPNYIVFLCAKISYFQQMSTGPIFIHKAIVNEPSLFHDDKSCRTTGTWSLRDEHEPYNFI